MNEDNWSTFGLAGAASVTGREAHSHAEYLPSGNAGLRIIGYEKNTHISKA
jgi:hypothetical protein